MRPDVADVRPDTGATDVPVDRADVADVALDRTDVADMALDRTEVATEVPADVPPDVQPDVQPAVDLGCTNACTLGAKQCGTGGGSQTCVAGGNGCTVWAAEVACGAHQTCNAGTCACVTAPAGCTAPGTFCSGGEVKTCTRDAQECLFVSASATCATNTSCKGTLPSAACGCDDTCTTLGAFCVDSKHTSNCVADTNSPACKIASASQLCPGTSSCVNGACACPAAGTTTGTGCTLNAAALCEGDDILTCVTDSDSGCNIWQASTHCGNNVGGRLTCGTPAGTAACVCPANGTTDEYVDPVAGSDGSGGVVPTGIQLPANCRWATLTKGLSMVAPTGKVVAISAAPPVTFGVEPTFPLNVAAGITLTTADATPNAANYKINFTAGGATSAVTLATGSTLQGFSIANTAGNNFKGVSCSAGTATVNTVVIDGAGTLNGGGIGITGSCAASLNAVSADNIAGAGVDVVSSAASSLTGGALTDSLFGLRVQQGTVTATGVTITGNATAGVQLFSSATPSVTLAQGTISSNGVGVDVATGTLSVTGTSITGNIGTGIRSVAGTTVTTNSATVVSTNGGSGLSIAGSTGAIHGTTVGGNMLDGVLISGSTASVVIDQSSIIDGNKQNGVVANAGTLFILGGTDVRNNLVDGVVLAGAESTINSAIVRTNQANGIRIVSSAVPIAIGAVGTTTDIATNVGNGILVDQALRNTNGAASLLINAATIRSNGARGIHLQGAIGDVFAIIRASTVSSNSQTGILVEKGLTGATSTIFQDNDITANGITSRTLNVGGLMFNTSSTLTGFTNNKIHSNVGNQLGFNAPQDISLPATPSTVWSITPPSGACDAASNSLYGYGGGGGNVGLFVPSALISVTARNVHWVRNPPQSLDDYSNTGTIDAAMPCSAITGP